MNSSALSPSPEGTAVSSVPTTTASSISGVGSSLLPSTSFDIILSWLVRARNNLGVGYEWDREFDLWEQEWQGAGKEEDTRRSACELNCFVTAIADYIPASEVELTFRVGDNIWLTSTTDAGWAYGGVSSDNGISWKEGWFPMSCTQRVGEELHTNNMNIQERFVSSSDNGILDHTCTT